MSGFNRARCTSCRSSVQLNGGWQGLGGWSALHMEELMRGQGIGAPSMARAEKKAMQGRCENKAMWAVWKPQRPSKASKGISLALHTLCIHFLYLSRCAWTHMYAHTCSIICRQKVIVFCVSLLYLPESSQRTSCFPNCKEKASHTLSIDKTGSKIITHILCNLISMHIHSHVLQHKRNERHFFQCFSPFALK